MSDYLQLMARVAGAQQSALARRAAGSVPDTALAASREYACPPLSAQSASALPNGAPIWQTLSMIYERSPPMAYWLPSLALYALDDVEQEALADRVLAGTSLDAEAALVPFVGAALQTYFTRLAATLDVALVEHCDIVGICPVCASRPAASVFRIGGEQANLRYLVCSLCDRMERGTHCLYFMRHRQRRQVFRVQAEGASEADAAARAETCDECKSYLKIFYQEKTRTSIPPSTIWPHWRLIC